MGRSSPRGRADHQSHVERLEQVSATVGLTVGRGFTPREVAARLRVSPEKVRAWIKAGKLAAVNTADAGCGKPRFIITPEALAEFERSRSAAPPPKPVKRRRRPEGTRDYFP